MQKIIIQIDFQSFEYFNYNLHITYYPLLGKDFIKNSMCLCPYIIKYNKFT